MKEEIGSLKRWLAFQLERFGSNGYLVCMSGGLDSATALKLSVDSVGKDKTFALTCIVEGISDPADMVHAKEFCRQLGVEHFILDMTRFFESYRSLFQDMSPLQVHTCMARLRPVIAYSLADKWGLKIMGTGNKSENVLQGWLHMTNASDVIPFVQFYKLEIREIAKEIGVPAHLIDKEPNDSMVNGVKDRDLYFGYGYEFIDPIIQALEEGDVSYLDTQDRKLVALLAHQRRRTRLDTEFPIFIR